MCRIFTYSVKEKNTTLTEAGKHSLYVPFVLIKIDPLKATSKNLVTSNHLSEYKTLIYLGMFVILLSLYILRTMV